MHRMLAATQRYNDPVATKIINIGAGETDGYVLNANRKVSPTDYIHSWYDFDTGHVILDKYVASVKTTLIDAAAAYVADKKLITACRREGASLEVSLFYNGAQIGTTQTISDAGILGGTYHYASGDGSGDFAVRRWALGQALLSGTFDSNTDGYVAVGDATLAWDGGLALVTINGASGGIGCTPDLSTENGKIYLCEADTFAGTYATALAIRFGGINVGVASPGTSLVGCGIANGATEELDIRRTGLSTGTVYVDNISVKEVLLP